jgi:F-type H+-transporting ATPase subunit a
MVLALEFPPINELVRWRDLFPYFNKVAIIAILAALVSILIFLLAARKDGTKAPRGVRNLAEIIIEFVEDQIVMPTMGRDGLKFTPFLLSLFLFIYLCNLPGIIPVIYMPATARLAIPLFLALVVWIVFVGVGIAKQGLGYFGHLIWPPGVPVALKPLVGLIELVSTILVRPFSLTVRLFANMFAGHILLVTFSLLTEELIGSSTFALKPLAILPFFMLLFITSFEVLVGFLQAYIFAMLAGVYIGTSQHPEH